MRFVNDEDVKKTFQKLLTMLPDCPICTQYWSIDGEEILCRDEQHAECLADFIDTLYGGRVCNTGYYDMEEDLRNGEVDGRTGFYYVTIS